MSEESESERRAYVSGATGYLGRHICLELLNRGYLVATSVRTTSHLPRLEELVGCGNVEDLGHSERIPDIVEMVHSWQPTVVIQSAAFGRASHEISDIPKMLESNVFLGTALLEATRGLSIHQPCSFIGIGSFWQHSGPDVGYHPNSLYAATKQALECIGAYYREIEHVPCLFLRPTDIYGPHDERARFLTLAASACLTGVPLEASSGKQLVSFVHVRDVADATAFAADVMSQGTSHPDLSYSVTGPTTGRLRELVSRLEADLGITIPISWNTRSSGQPGDAMLPDFGSLLPGWQPSVGLSEGFAEMMEGSDGQASEGR